MGEITMCPTKAGNGYKIVVDGVWYYTSKREMGKMLREETNAAKFRSFDEWNKAEA